MARLDRALAGRRWLVRVGMVAAALATVGVVAFLAVHVPKVMKIRALAAMGGAGAAPSVEPVSYQSEGRRIAADLYLPASPERYAVFAHGNRPAGRSHPLARAIANALGRHFATLAFDFRGYGESDAHGGYTPGMTLDFSADVIHGAHYLARRFGAPPEEVVLVGHSFGAGQVLLAGKRLGSRHVVAVGAGDVETLFEDPDFAPNQARKLRRIGLDPPPEEIREMYEHMFARNLFQGCWPARIHLISGARDPGLATLDDVGQRSDRSCEQTIERTDIPYADHMFWSERRGTTRFRLYSLAIGADDWTQALVGAIVRRLAPEQPPEG